MNKAAQGQVSGAQRMRARDVGGSSLSATPVTPSAADAAAQQVAQGAVSTPAAPTPRAQSGQSLAGQVATTAQPGATAAGYMASQGLGGNVPPGVARTTQVAAQPAPNPFKYNPQAARMETNQISDMAYEAWTGPHEYQGQPVDMKYVLNYADGAAAWRPTGDLRQHQGVQRG